MANIIIIVGKNISSDQKIASGSPWSTMVTMAQPIAISTAKMVLFNSDTVLEIAIHTLDCVIVAIIAIATEAIKAPSRFNGDF